MSMNENNFTNGNSEMSNWNLDSKKSLEKIQNTQNFFKATIKAVLPIAAISFVWISSPEALWKQTRSQADSSVASSNVLQAKENQTDFLVASANWLVSDFSETNKFTDEDKERLDQLLMIDEGNLTDDERNEMEDLKEERDDSLKLLSFVLENSYEDVEKDVNAMITEVNRSLSKIDYYNTKIGKLRNDIEIYRKYITMAEACKEKTPDVIKKFVSDITAEMKEIKEMAEDNDHDEIIVTTKDGVKKITDGANTIEISAIQTCEDIIKASNEGITKAEKSIKIYEEGKDFEQQIIKLYSDQIIKLHNLFIRLVTKG